MTTKKWVTIRTYRQQSLAHESCRKIEIKSRLKIQENFRFVTFTFHLVNEIHKKAQSNPVRLMVCWVAKLGLTCQLSDNISGTSKLIKVPAFDVNQRRIKPQITINQASWSIATSALSSFVSLLIHISVSSV